MRLVPRTPLLERTGPLRLLGVGFLCLILLFVWITYAFFNKTFETTVPITVEASSTGLQLPRYADVKLRDMIVGEVRDVTPVEDGVELEIALQPEMVERIPSNVTANILPKTLFGEKFVHLDVEGEPSAESLEAGDVITGAEVPIEIEELMIDSNELLQAISPEDLSYTLNAVAEALEGQGDDIGRSIVTANDYLQQIAPEIPMLIDDLDKLGDVADVYDTALPDIADTLDNAMITGDTIVEKRGELNEVLVASRNTFDTAHRFLDVNADVLMNLPGEIYPVVEALEYHSPMMTCTLQGIAGAVPRLDSVLRDHTVHINLELLPLDRMPTPYEPDEFVTVPDEQWFNQTPDAQPDCRTLPDEAVDAFDRSGDNYPPIPEFALYEELGLNDPHNKFDWAGRPPAAETDEAGED